MATSRKKALRHERVYYINTTPAENTANFVLFGQGTNSLTNDMGATVEEDHYITDKNGSSTRTATAKVQSFNGDMIIGDAAQDYLATKVYALGTDAETDWIEVDAYNEPTERNNLKYYPARKVTAMINITNDGSGDAGAALQFEGEIRWQGDPVEGYFERTGKTFVTELPTQG